MFKKGLKMYFHGWVGVGGGGGGWVAGSIKTKAISASNLKLKLKLTEAELGNIFRLLHIDLDYLVLFKTNVLPPK